MLRTLQNIFTKRYHRFWLGLCAGLVLLAYIALIPLAAAKGDDFVHLWIGGHLAAKGQIAQLYEPAAHKDLLAQHNLLTAEYWGERYEILGVFFYPPTAALLYAPLGLLPLYWAQATQAVVNILLGICAAWLLTRIIQGRLRFATVLLLLFTYPSFLYTYALGQNGILTTTLVLGSWSILQTGRQWWGGALLSLLVFKPNWLLAFGWIPLVQRRWQMVIGIGSGLLLLLLVTIATVGIAPLQTYIETLLNLMNLHYLPDYPLAIQYSILSLSRRYLGMGTAADLVGWGVIFAIIIMTIWALYRNQTRTDLPSAAGQSRFVRSAALTWVAAVCLNPHLHHYDLTMVSVAMIMALSEWAVLSRWQRYWVGSLLLLNHFAFVITDGLALNETLPLPIFTMLALWGWLWLRTIHVEQSPTLTPVFRKAMPEFVKGYSGHWVR